MKKLLLMAKAKSDETPEEFAARVSQNLNARGLANGDKLVPQDQLTKILAKEQAAMRRASL